MCICVSAPKASGIITSGIIRHDMDPILGECMALWGKRNEPSIATTLCLHPYAIRR